MDAHLLAARQESPEKQGPTGAADPRKDLDKWFDGLTAAARERRFNFVIQQTNHLIDAHGLVSRWCNLDDFRMAMILSWRGECLEQEKTMSAIMGALRCYTAAKEKLYNVSGQTNEDTEQRNSARSLLNAMIKACDRVNREIDSFQNNIDPQLLNDSSPLHPPHRSSGPQQSPKPQEGERLSTPKQSQILTHGHPISSHQTPKKRKAPGSANQEPSSSPPSRSTQSDREYKTIYKSTPQRPQPSSETFSVASFHDATTKSTRTSNPIFGQTYPAHLTDPNDALGQSTAMTILSLPSAKMPPPPVLETEDQRRHCQTALQDTLGKLESLARDMFRHHDEIILLTGVLLDRWEMSPLNRAEVIRIRAKSFHMQMTRSNNAKALRNIKDALNILGEFKPKKWNGPYFKSLTYRVEKRMQAYRKEHDEFEKYFRDPSYSKFLAPEVPTQEEINKEKYTMKEKLELTDHEWTLRELGLARHMYGM